MTVQAGLCRTWSEAKIVGVFSHEGSNIVTFQQQGAATTVYCCVAPELENVGGLYFNNCCNCPPSAAGTDDALAKALWDISERMLSKRIGRPI